MTLRPRTCHRVRNLSRHPPPSPPSISKAGSLPETPRAAQRGGTCGLGRAQSQSAGRAAGWAVGRSLSRPVLPAAERILASGSVQLPRFTLLESGSLLVSPTHISDAGTYTCLATNSRGADEASADLVVWGECAEHVLSTRKPPQSTHSHRQHPHTHACVRPGHCLREGLGQISSEERDQGRSWMMPRERGLVTCVAELGERGGDGQLSSCAFGAEISKLSVESQVVNILGFVGQTVSLMTPQLTPRFH